MIGNVIQGQYLGLADYPEASALSFVLLALIMVVVFAYFRVAGTGAITGDDTPRRVDGGGRPGWPPGPADALAGATGRRHLRGLAVAYMLIPIAVIVLFSFNDPAGNFNVTWQGFTLDYWADPFSNRELNDAMLLSLELAALATVIATAMGTLLALALVRHRFRGRRAVNLLLVVPLATPEVVIGAALLSMFVYLGVARGFGTLLIAHVMFSISFVTIVVRSRLVGFDRSLEEAAADLGAGPLARFRTITLPLLAPAIASAALLAFVLSIDDFVISNFNSGTSVTFPLYIFGASQRGIPVQINVLATMLLLLTVVAMVATVWQQRRADRLAAPLPGHRVETPLSGRRGNPASPEGPRRRRPAGPRLRRSPRGPGVAASPRGRRSPPRTGPARPERAAGPARPARGR